MTPECDHDRKAANRGEAPVQANFTKEGRTEYGCQPPTVPTSNIALCSLDTVCVYIYNLSKEV